MQPPPQHQVPAAHQHCKHPAHVQLEPAVVVVVVGEASVVGCRCHEAHQYGADVDYIGPLGAGPCRRLQVPARQLGQEHQRWQQVQTLTVSVVPLKHAARCASNAGA